MKKRFPPGVLLLLLASLLANVFFVTKSFPNYVVSSVIDGDTFILKSGERIRLLGVNAPEIGRCGSEQAKTLLTFLILNKPVLITETTRDYYGRRMGLVYTGTTLVNTKIISQGWARPDYTKNSKNENMKQAYREAKEKKRGINGELCKKINPIPKDPACAIKGNIDNSTGTHFYHFPSCRHYNQIVLDEDIGEQFFCSEQEAKDAGFILASDCLR
ncbi:MAG: thermonuclease family protein [Candidatus Gottesmanbacteria bacterium]